jgi:hypothetical protein
MKGIEMKLIELIQMLEDMRKLNNKILENGDVQNYFDEMHAIAGHMGALTFYIRKASENVTVEVTNDTL